MQTHSGKAFTPLDPSLGDIDIEDIAHALGNICRYGGHTRWFYSVAEHCVLMSEAVSPENAFWALMHDAAEAYVGDLIRPLKINLPEYREIEDNIMLAICTKFGMDYDCPPEVKLADTRILHDERAVMLGTPSRAWVIDERSCEPLGVKVTGWDPYTAKRAFMTRFRQVTQ